ADSSFVMFADRSGRVEVQYIVNALLGDRKISFEELIQGSITFQYTKYSVIFFHYKSD
ncbi:hypothetical protein KI387_014691, partial [Taxus chinensis]